MPTGQQITSRRLATPLRVGPSGGFAVITNPEHIAIQEIRTLVLTSLETRLMRSGYGTSTMRSLFRLDIEADNVSGEILSELQDQVTTCLVIAVDIVSLEASTLTLAVRFSLNETEPQVLTTNFDLSLEA